MGLPEIVRTVEPESAEFATLTLEARPTDFDVQRAIDVYIPLLRASYALANAQPVVLPSGFETLGEIRSNPLEMLEAAMSGQPEAGAAVRNDELTLESIAVPEAFGFAVREIATGWVIVSIRGTQTPEEWVKNFTAIPSPFTEVPGFGLVHLGFEHMWERVRGSVQTALADVPAAARITLLGHSLGGAMATLGAVSLRKNAGRNDVDVCTFGCPRVGMFRFRTNFDRLIGKCFRVTNLGDIVPHVPSLLMGFNHVGRELEVNGKTAGPHSLDSYLAGLKNLGAQPAGLPVTGVAVLESMQSRAVLDARTL